jgi:hypothetical protein
MKLDYIENINEYGDHVVRLFDFDKSEAEKFRQLIEQTILINNESLDLSTIDFIEPINCNLIFRISDSDEGIEIHNNPILFCDLTLSGYKKMLALIEPFCLRETMGYQWLYDIDSSTDLVFSPGGV